jgi:hypothetical protein
MGLKMMKKPVFFRIFKSYQMTTFSQPISVYFRTSPDAISITSSDAQKTAPLICKLVELVDSSWMAIWTRWFQHPLGNELEE